MDEYVYVKGRPPDEIIDFKNEYKVLLQKLNPKKNQVIHNLKTTYGLGYRQLAETLPIYLPKDSDEQITKIIRIIR